MNVTPTGATPTSVPLPKRVKDIIGIRRGLLVITGYVGTGENRHARWMAHCDCGKDHIVEGAAFLRWMYRSCGCYRDKQVGDANRTHGKSKSKLYQIWASMIQRCTNPNHPAYARYGGRGITVCERWLHSFENFYEDMKDRPSEKHTLDRLDNSKGYSPENCAWKTYKEQARNRRSNRILSHGGENLVVAAWTERNGLADSTIRKRLDNGWTIEEAVTTPSMHPKKDPLADFEWV